MRTFLLAVNLGLIVMFITLFTALVSFLVTEWERLNRFERSLFALSALSVYIFGLTI